MKRERIKDLKCPVCFGVLRGDLLELQKDIIIGGELGRLGCGRTYPVNSLNRGIIQDETGV